MVTAKKKGSARKPRPTAAVAWEIPAEHRALMLRTVDADHCAHGGFQWPREVDAIVVAPDWDPRPVLGGGLHGLLWGEGDYAQLQAEDLSRVWQVCEIDAREAVEVERKIKVPRCRLVHIGDRFSATTWLAEHGGHGRAIAYGTATAGPDGTATAGPYGTATAGRGGTANAGRGGTATAGPYGTATAGPYGTATAGDDGTATAGPGGTATAGAGGTATAGTGGTATAGDGGTATAGTGGTATAGDGGTLLIQWSDGRRRRTGVFYVGEDGVEAGVPYRLDDHGKLVREDRANRLAAIEAAKSKAGAR